MNKYGTVLGLRAKRTRLGRLHAAASILVLLDKTAMADELRSEADELADQTYTVMFDCPACHKYAEADVAVAGEDEPDRRPCKACTGKIDASMDALQEVIRTQK